MDTQTLYCHVTIKRAQELQPRDVRCYLDGGYFLVIPVGDYSIPRANGKQDMMLRISPQWLIPCEDEDTQLLCQKLIDLDDFDALTWAEFEPPKVD